MGRFLLGGAVRNRTRPVRGADIWSAGAVGPPAPGGRASFAGRCGPLNAVAPRPVSGQGGRMGWTFTHSLDAFEAAAGAFLRARPVECSVPLTVTAALRRRGHDAYGSQRP